MKRKRVTGIFRGKNIVLGMSSWVIIITLLLVGWLAIRNPKVLMWFKTCIFFSLKYFSRYFPFPFISVKQATAKHTVKIHSNANSFKPTEKTTSFKNLPPQTVITLKHAMKKYCVSRCFLLAQNKMQKLSASIQARAENTSTVNTATVNEDLCVTDDSFKLTATVSLSLNV